MIRPSFNEGLLLALFISLVSSFLYAALTWFLSELGVIQLLITLTSFFYMMYLLVRSDETRGRVVIVAIWGAMTVLLWVLSVPITLYCLLYIGYIWLVRSLYYYSSLFCSVVDFVLVALSLLFSTWAYYETYSVFMSLWCFFLMQSLFVFIPEKTGSFNTKNNVRHKTGDFNQSFKNANEAVRKLSALQ